MILETIYNTLVVTKMLFAAGGHHSLLLLKATTFGKSEWQEILVTLIVEIIPDQQPAIKVCYLH